MNNQIINKIDNIANSYKQYSNDLSRSINFIKSGGGKKDQQLNRLYTQMKNYKKLAENGFSSTLYFKKIAEYYFALLLSHGSYYSRMGKKIEDMKNKMNNMNDNILNRNVKSNHDIISILENMSIMVEGIKNMTIDVGVRENVGENILELERLNIDGHAQMGGDDKMLDSNEYDDLLNQFKETNVQFKNVEDNYEFIDQRMEKLKEKLSYIVHDNSHTNVSKIKIDIEFLVNALEKMEDGKGGDVGKIDLKELKGVLASMQDKYKNIIAKNKNLTDQLIELETLKTQVYEMTKSLKTLSSFIDAKNRGELATVHDAERIGAIHNIQTGGDGSLKQMYLDKINGNKSIDFSIDASINTNTPIYGKFKYISIQYTQNNKIDDIDKILEIKNNITQIVVVLHELDHIIDNLVKLNKNEHIRNLLLNTTTGNVNVITIWKKIFEKKKTDFYDLLLTKKMFVKYSDYKSTEEFNKLIANYDSTSDQPLIAIDFDKVIDDMIKSVTSPPASAPPPPLSPSPPLSPTATPSPAASATASATAPTAAAAAAATPPPAPVTTASPTATASASASQPSPSAATASASVPPLPTSTLAKNMYEFSKIMRDLKDNLLNTGMYIACLYYVILQYSVYYISFYDSTNTNLSKIYPAVQSFGDRLPKRFNVDYDDIKFVYSKIIQAGGYVAIDSTIIDIIQSTTDIFTNVIFDIISRICDSVKKNKEILPADIKKNVLVKMKNEILTSLNQINDIDNTIGKAIGDIDGNKIDNDSILAKITKYIETDKQTGYKEFIAEIGKADNISDIVEAVKKFDISTTQMGGVRKSYNKLKVIKYKHIQKGGNNVAIRKQAILDKMKIKRIIIQCLIYGKEKFKKIIKDFNDDDGNIEEFMKLYSLIEDTIAVAMKNYLMSLVMIFMVIEFPPEFIKKDLDKRSKITYDKSKKSLILTKRDNKSTTCDGIDIAFLANDGNNETDKMLKNKTISILNILNAASPFSLCKCILFALGASGTGKTTRLILGAGDVGKQGDKVGVIKYVIDDVKRKNSSVTINIHYFVCYGRYIPNNTPGNQLFQEIIIFFNMNDVNKLIIDDNVEWVAYKMKQTTNTGINKYTAFYSTLMEQTYEKIGDNTNGVQVVDFLNGVNAPLNAQQPQPPLTPPTFRNILTKHLHCTKNVVVDHIEILFNIFANKQKQLSTVGPTQNNISSSRGHTCIVTETITNGNSTYLPTFDMAGTENPVNVSNYLKQFKNKKHLLNLFVAINKEDTLVDDIDYDGKVLDKRSVNKMVSFESIINGTNTAFRTKVREYLGMGVPVTTVGGGNKYIKDFKYELDNDSIDAKQFIQKIPYEGSYIVSTINTIIAIVACVGKSMSSMCEYDNSTGRMRNDTFDDIEPAIIAELKNNKICFVDDEYKRLLDSLSSDSDVTYITKDGCTTSRLLYNTDEVTDRGGLFNVILNSSCIWAQVLFSFIYWNESTPEFNKKMIDHLINNGKFSSTSDFKHNNIKIDIGNYISDIKKCKFAVSMPDENAINSDVSIDAIVVRNVTSEDIDFLKFFDKFAIDKIETGSITMSKNSKNYILSNDNFINTVGDVDPYEISQQGFSSKISPEYVVYGVFYALYSALLGNSGPVTTINESSITYNSNIIEFDDTFIKNLLIIVNCAENIDNAILNTYFITTNQYDFIINDKFNKSLVTFLSDPTNDVVLYTGYIRSKSDPTVQVSAEITLKDYVVYNFDNYVAIDDIKLIQIKPNEVVVNIGQLAPMHGSEFFKKLTAIRKIDNRNMLEQGFQTIKTPSNPHATKIKNTINNFMKKYIKVNRTDIHPIRRNYFDILKIYTIIALPLSQFTPKSITSFDKMKKKLNELFKFDDKSSFITSVNAHIEKIKGTDDTSEFIIEYNKRTNKQNIYDAVFKIIGIISQYPKNVSDIIQIANMALHLHTGIALFTDNTLSKYQEQMRRVQDGICLQSTMINLQLITAEYAKTEMVEEVMGLVQQIAKAVSV